MTTVGAVVGWGSVGAPQTSDFSNSHSRDYYPELASHATVCMKVEQFPFLPHFKLGTSSVDAPIGCASCARVWGRFLPSLVDSGSRVERPPHSPCSPEHHFMSML